MIDYRGQVALVTGGGSGIGRALAVALAGRGARVIAADIDADGAAETARLAGGDALVADLALPGAATDLIARAYALAGRIDVIASNAGMGSGPGPKRLLKAEGHRVVKKGQRYFVADFEKALFRPAAVSSA